jgi:hypothetical protein
MGAISYFSSFDTDTPSSVPLLGLDGPRNELTFGWDILAVAILGVFIYALAIRSRLPAERTLEYIGDVTSEAEPEDGESRRPEPFRYAAPSGEVVTGKADDPR